MLSALARDTLHVDSLLICALRARILLSISHLHRGLTSSCHVIVSCRVVLGSPLLPQSDLTAIFGSDGAEMRRCCGQVWASNNSRAPLCTSKPAHAHSLSSSPPAPSPGQTTSSLQGSRSTPSGRARRCATLHGGDPPCAPKPARAHSLSLSPLLHPWPGRVISARKSLNTLTYGDRMRNTS